MMEAPVLLLGSALAENGGDAGKTYILDSENTARSKNVTILSRSFPNGRLELDLSVACGYQEYSLRAILNLWELRNESYSEYMKKMTSLGEESATFIDRRLILDFLNGITKTLPVGSNSDFKVPYESPKTLFSSQSSSSEVKSSQRQDPKQGPAIELKDLEVSLKISSGQINLGDYGSLLFIPETSPKNFAQVLEIGQNLLIAGKRDDTTDLDYAKFERAPPPTYRGSGIKEPKSSSTSQDNLSTAQKTQMCTNPPLPQMVKPAAFKRHSRHPESTPFIIVPSGVQSMINLLNVKSFLADGLYVPITEIQDIYQQRPEYVVIERQIKLPHGTGFRTSIRRYKVIDSVDKLRSSDWNKVVAAFVTGQTWQFKKWKWNEPAELFGKIRGFCVKYVDDPSPGLVGKWSVVHLIIHRTWRHNDRSAVNQFWKEVDNFLLQSAASRSRSRP